MRKTVLLILIITVSVMINSGCKKPENDPRPLVITTLFPQYDFARQIGGEKINLKLLLNPGVEAHSFEPTPRDIADISKARLFIYTGRFMEPWAERIIKGIKNENLTVVDAGKGIKLLQIHEAENDGHHDGDHSEEDHHHHGGKDPHIWLDPINALSMIDNILEGLINCDPDNRLYYENNAEKFKKEVLALHRDFTEMFKKAKHKMIIFGGHYAFRYFSNRYGLDYISPYSGFSPDAEPSPGKIAELIKVIEKTGIGVIYYEELIDPRVARVISEQTGVEMMLLHGVHNISKKDYQSGATYISIMRKNLESLKKGLEYTE